MRICRFNDNRLGLVADGLVRDVSDALDVLPPLSWPAPPGDHFYNHFDLVRSGLEGRDGSGAGIPIGAVELLSPVANPGKIIGAPVNYQLHLDESRADRGINFGTSVKTIHEYGVFLKATSSLIGPSQAVQADWTDRRTDHEIELALVIGKQGFRIARSEALDHVAHARGATVVKERRAARDAAVASLATCVAKAAETPAFRPKLKGRTGPSARARPVPR